MRSETVGRGSVADAPTASKVSGREAKESIAHSAAPHKEEGLCFLASCLARRYRLSLAIAWVAAEQRWRP
jgi:hypothetical protein